MPLSLLGPYDAVKGLGLGAKYKLTDKLEVSTGAQYMKIKGGVVPSDKPDSPLLKVNDSHGYAAGIRVGYHF